MFATAFLTTYQPKKRDIGSMALDDIRQNIDRDIREPLLPVCRALVDRLATMKPDQLQRLTYMLLADFVQRRPDDDVFQSALTALTTIKHNPLTMYFVFYDAGEDREIPISVNEAMLSVDEALFIHPRTGEEVADFERQLKPVFRASNEFVSALTNRHAG
jgi:hypothetical protein